MGHPHFCQTEILEKRQNFGKFGQSGDFFDPLSASRLQKCLCILTFRTGLFVHCFFGPFMILPDAHFWHFITLLLLKFHNTTLIFFTLLIFVIFYHTNTFYIFLSHYLFHFLTTLIFVTFLQTPEQSFRWTPRFMWNQDRHSVLNAGKNQFGKYDIYYQYLSSISILFRVLNLGGKVPSYLYWWYNTTCHSNFYLLNFIICWFFSFVEISHSLKFLILWIFSFINIFHLLKFLLRLNFCSVEIFHLQWPWYIHIKAFPTEGTMTMWWSTMVEKPPRRWRFPPEKTFPSQGKNYY